MTKKLFLSVLLSLVIIFGVFAEITVVEDKSSNYSPTKIVNGSFSSKPWMTYVYGGVTYDSSTDGYTSKNITPSSITVNGVDGGWNTSETSTYKGNLFEWSGNSTIHCHFNVTNVALAAADRYYVDMNCNNPSVLYQDLSTIPGDVVRWSLQHAPSITGNAETVQDMHVEVGTPNGTPSGTNSNINSNGKAIYKSTGITLGAGTVAFANSSELVNLSVSRAGKTATSYSDTVDEANSFFKDVAGVYCIPAGQTVTRFAFVSDDTSKPTCGNLLSNLTFNTLIGNLSGYLNSDGSVTIKGYWGETDSSKKLIIKSGNTTNSIAMTSVLEKNFEITIPSENIDEDSLVVDVYHEDYEVAKKTIHIHKWAYTKNCQQIMAYCTNTQGSDQCSYQGRENAVDVTLATNRMDFTANFDPSNVEDDYAVWSSENEAVVAIDSSKGIARSVQNGATTITASSLNGSAKARTIPVKVLPETEDSSVKVTSLTLNKTSLALNGGQTETLTATVAPTNAAVKTVTWMSSDRTIAKVNSSTGLVTAVSSGTATITAVANDGSGKMASCTVTVTVPVTGVAISRTSMSLEQGKSATLSAYALPAGATNSAISWSTSDASVATVINGVVKGLSVGSATITVTTADGSYTATCNVTVNKKTSVTENESKWVEFSSTSAFTL